MVIRVLALHGPVVVWAFAVGAGVALVSYAFGFLSAILRRREKIDQIARLLAGEELDRLRSENAALRSENTAWSVATRALGVGVDEIAAARMRQGRG